MIIVPLGVASATPTATRHLSSVVVWREGQQFLFDCGENTQMRMLQAGMKRSNVDYIMLSHFDVDHYTGLIGLLATFQLQRRDKSLTIVGPTGLQEYLDFNLKFANVDLQYDLNVVELSEDFEHERVVDESDFYIEARPLDHSKFCIGYRLQEKDRPGKVDAVKAKASGISEDWQYKDLKAGKDVELENGNIVKSSDIVGPPQQGDSFAYCTDTRPCENAVKLGEKASVLYHEATFGDSLTKKAKETGHSTSRQAAQIASKANAKLLVICHFSARYTNQFVLLRESREEFKNTWVATELRPIMTDIEHEKGIISPRVEIRDLTNKTKKRHSSRGRSDSRDRKPRRKKRIRRSRSYNNDRSGSRRPRRSGSSRDFDKSKYKKRTPRDDSGSERSRDRSEQENNRTERKPKHITPRTPFDDFNRF